MKHYLLHICKSQVISIGMIAVMVGVMGAVINFWGSYPARAQAPISQDEMNHIYLPLIVGSETSVTTASPRLSTTDNSAAKAVSNSDPTSEETAFLPAAESYVEKYKVSLEEAVNRIKLQTKIGALNAKLEKNESESLAGLWIEHEPDYKVVVQFTHDAEATLEPYLADISFAHLIEVRTAQFSVQELENIQQLIMEKIKVKESSTGMTIQADLAVNVKQNRIDIFVTDLNAVDWSDILGEDSQHATIVKVDQLPSPAADIRAGFYFDGNNCTIGWNVTYDGGRYASTAYHCPAILYAGNTLTTKQGWFEANADLELFYAPAGYSLPNRWQYMYGSNVVTTERGKNDTTIGHWLCHIGATTGWQCGTVTSKNYQYWWLPSGNKWVATNIYTCPGDSGGPVLVDIQAFGMTIAGSCGGDNLSIYMSLDEFWDRGVHVATSS